MWQMRHITILLLSIKKPTSAAFKKKSYEHCRSPILEHEGSRQCLYEFYAALILAD
jgi:hypothetical protein